MASESRGARKNGAAVAAALTVTAALGACGGANFIRDDGAKKYRPLPLGTTVRLAATVEELPQPVEALGTLTQKADSNDATPDRTAATEALRRAAAGYGCDAVVGAEAKTTEKISKRQVRELGPDGKPVFREEQKKSYEHTWTARCVRTAEAPAEVARGQSQVAAGGEGTTVATPAPAKADAKRGRKGAAAGGKGDTEASERAAAKAASDRAAAARAAEARAADAKDAAARDAEARDAEARAAEARAAEAKAAEAKAAEAKGTQGGGTGVISPPATDEDPAIASEVARAFMVYSRAAASGDHATICRMFDKERVYFDIRVESPAWEHKVDLTAEAGCQSLAGGDLARYLRDYGPAEIHAEMATLIPTLFGIHRGAFLKLDDARDAEYREKVAASRAGKPPLACQMYTVHAAGNLFKITLDCRGVKSYRLLIRRDGPDDFKLMALTLAR